MTASERVHLEELILAALCQGACDPAARNEVMRRLSSYSFATASHQIVYRALASIPTADPWRLRELLPSRLNNLGFPDTDWENLFAPRAFEKDLLAAPLDSLLAS
jgi:hypothetical protein